MDLKEERSNLPSMDYILDNRFESVWSVYHLIYGEIGGSKGFSLMKKISLENPHAQNKRGIKRPAEGVETNVLLNHSSVNTKYGSVSGA